MLYILGVIVGLLLINVFLLKFSCNGCEKINHKQQEFRFQQSNQNIKLQEQMAFDK